MVSIYALLDVYDKNADEYKILSALQYTRTVFCFSKFRGNCQSKWYHYYYY